MNDCSFEEGDCDWHKFDDLFSVERGEWKWYAAANKNASLFKGLDRDTTFPSGYG